MIRNVLDPTVMRDWTIFNWARDLCPVRWKTDIVVHHTPKAFFVSPTDIDEEHMFINVRIALRSKQYDSIFRCRLYWLPVDHFITSGKYC